MRSSPQSRSSWLMISGGASLITLPWVSLASTPRAASRSHTSRPGSDANSSPAHRPRPRTEVIAEEGSPPSRACMRPPSTLARAWYSPVRSMATTARPTAQASGWPPNVDPCCPGCSTPSTGQEVVAMLRTGEYQARARVLGERMHARLAGLPSSVVTSVRGRGLRAGLEFASLPGREVCERLAARGVLAKETHGNVIRLAPPLIIRQDDLDWGLDRIEDAIRD